MELPRVLLDPPWLKRPPAAAGEAPPKLAAIEIPPDVVWAEGQRESFRGEIAPPTSPSAADDDELLERILDALDAGRPLREVDLARLSDDAAIELLADAGGNLGARALRHLLGRLDARGVRSVLAAVEAKLPNLALVPVLEPVRSPRVAPLMAELLTGQATMERAAEQLRAERFAPGVAERWLESFPDVAAVGLLPAAVDPERPGHATALRALSYLAARGLLEEAKKGAARHGETAALALADLGDLAPLASLASQPGLDWLPRLLAEGHDAPVIELLADVDEPAAAPLFARWLAEGTLARKSEAERWLRAHPDAVRVGLGAMTAPPSVAARAAAAGELLASGEGAAERDALERTPVHLLPMPGFWKPEDLPELRLQDGSTLPPAAVEHIGTMLRFSPIDPPYPGLAQVAEVCDPTSLDDFAVAIYERWRASGEPVDQVWALRACGFLGGPSAAAAVARDVRSWARGVRDSRGSRAEGLAKEGLAALGRNGSDVALMHLESLARRGPSGWLRRDAERALGDRHGPRGGDASEVVGEAVPDFGLGRDGTLVLETGSRTLIVGFDEHLAPTLREGDEALSSFPRKRAADDERYDGAKRKWNDLKRGVSALASHQIASLEDAMCRGVRFPSDVFFARYVEHPLLRQLGRRLVLVSWEEGVRGPSLRVAEDGTLADANEATYALPDGASLSIAHPIELPELARFREIFADYQLLQPFPQLDRELHALPPELAGATSVPFDAELLVAPGRFFGLRHRGWRARPGHTLEGGAVMRKDYDDDTTDVFEKDLPDGHLAWVSCTPGITRGDARAQRVSGVEVSARLGALSEVAYSELVRDVRYLFD